MNTIRLGRLFGFPFSVEPTALLFMGAFALRDAMSGGAAGAIDSIARYGLVLLMVVVHELGHALVARRYDKGEIHIVLSMLGGYTVTRARPRPGWGLAMVVAGPLTGFVLGVVALVARLALGSVIDDPAYLDYLVIVSVFWSAFNLLPMFPLDGGQALYYALRLRWDEARAMTAAARVGVLAAIGVITVGLLTGQFFIVIVAALALFQSGARARLLG